MGDSVSSKASNVVDDSTVGMWVMKSMVRSPRLIMYEEGSSKRCVKAEVINCRPLVLAFFSREVRALVTESGSISLGDRVPAMEA